MPSDPEPPAPETASTAGPGTEWDAVRVRRLRTHLAETQGGLAHRLGTRQQTVSEWETGASRPRGMSQRLLHLVAEQSGFYSTGRPAATPDGAPSDSDGSGGEAGDRRGPGAPDDPNVRGRDGD